MGQADHKPAGVAPPGYCIVMLPDPVMYTQ
jgi:hypothetical protein